VRESAAGQGAEQTIREVSPALYGRNPFVHLGVILLCLLLVGVFMYLYEWLRCRATRLIVTTERTTLRTGILSRQTNEVMHSDLRNVQVLQTAWGRIVGVGTLELSSAGQSNVEIEVAGIPDPQGVADLIRQHR
jgi:uncharacterized membrane protein YdbT with pleckstrin-like domain